MANAQFLDDSWRLWFHDPNSEDWSKESYRCLGEISTVREFTELYVAYHDMFSRGMFFLMRSHILPIWEDPANIQGGAFSFRILHDDVENAWFQMCVDLLTEQLSKDPEDYENVCGVSISPKRGCSIIRVWIHDKSKDGTDLYHWNVPEYSAVMFKPHSGG